MIHRHPMPYELLCTFCSVYNKLRYATLRIHTMYVCCGGRHKYTTSRLWLSLSLSLSLALSTRTVDERAADHFIHIAALRCIERQNIIQLSVNTRAHRPPSGMRDSDTHTHRHRQYLRQRIHRNERAHVQLSNTHTHGSQRFFVDVSENDSSANVLIGLNH